MSDVKGLNFSNGEALHPADLNKAQLVTEQFAWEFPDFANLLAAHRAIETSLTYKYGVKFSLPSDFRKFCFTKAGGLELTYSGLGVSIGGGMVGVSYATLNPGQDMDPQIRWAYFGNGEAGTTHVAATNKRYDLIRVKIDALTGGNETRHFKDGVSGSLSSSSTPKRRILRPVVDIQQGVDSATPTVPAVTAGYAVMAVVLVDGGAISQVNDTTTPWGAPRVISPLINRQVIGSPTHWTVGTAGLMTATGTTFAFEMVGPAPGDSTMRVLALELGYKLSAGAAVKLIRSEPSGVSITEVQDLTSYLTLDNTARRTVVPMIPEFSTGFPFAFWAHGERRKETFPANPGSWLGLRVKAGATNDEFWAASWHVAQG